jgi:hypothetical protein
MKKSTASDLVQTNDVQAIEKARQETSEVTLRAEIHDPEFSIGLNFSNWKTFEREREGAFDSGQVEISFVKGPPEAKALFEAIRPDANNVKSYFDTWEASQEKARVREDVERAQDRGGRGVRSI